jgi:hypothetical protein
VRGDDHEKLPDGRWIARYRDNEGRKRRRRDAITCDTRLRKLLRSIALLRCLLGSDGRTVILQANAGAPFWSSRTSVHPSKKLDEAKTSPGIRFHAGGHLDWEGNYERDRNCYRPTDSVLD